MEKIPKKSNKAKHVSREELLILTKEELADRIVQLEIHNTNLKNIIAKKVTDVSKPAKKEKQRDFDFSKSHYRHVLLHILYFGWDYQGFVVQEDTAETIENHLFEALSTTCLIQSRETSRYHRCGRTDKGVSSYGQVVSILIRSKHAAEDQDSPDALANELPYCKMLNRLLPKEIRAVTWMPIPRDNPEYSARFDCKRRQYKYYFPRGAFSIRTMRDACRLLIGNHDFRNFCKMDVGNGVTEFRRTVLNADVVPVDDNDVDRPTSMYYLLIEGNAFLWHQIRCTVAILMLIGSGKETCDVITNLLDVETYEKKPQYHMAIDLPLNLFHCSYDNAEWVYDTEELGKVISHVQSMWTLENIKTTMIKDCLRDLEVRYHEVTRTEDGSRMSEEDSVLGYSDCLAMGTKPRVYTPLLKRQTCSSLEERIEHYKKRRKVPKSDDNMDCTIEDQ